jgi:hypothetical protein
VLKLLAVDEREGWVFVEEAGRIALIRPPYRQGDKRPVSDSVLGRAVREGDFEPQEGNFSGWAELIGFVKKAVVARAKREGWSGDSDVGDELLKIAPAVLLEKILDQVEKVLIPQSQLVVADEILDSILIGSPRMNDAPQLAERVKRLKVAVKQSLKAKKEARERSVRDDTPYPRLAKRRELDSSHAQAEAIRHSGTMFGH